MAAILLAAHAARDDVGDPQQMRLALDDIIDETERSARIVKSVLQFSKAEPSEFQTLDVRDPVGRACEHTRKLAVQQGLRIELEQSEEPLFARGNAVELEQVFANLLSNAIEASGPRGRIEVRTRREHSSIQVSFCDDGRGMSEFQLARVLEPFYTTRGQEGGTGLGLSLCHGIVTAHGGILRFDTGVGAGTTVVVELPDGGSSRNPDAAHHGR